eukprot:COSAG02_NODE_7840_length_2823_cov_2.633627_2_plen_367_part_00
MVYHVIGPPGSKEIRAPQSFTDKLWQNSNRFLIRQAELDRPNRYQLARRGRNYLLLQLNCLVAISKLMRRSLFHELHRKLRHANSIVHELFVRPRAHSFERRSIHRIQAAKKRSCGCSSLEDCGSSNRCARLADLQPSFDRHVGMSITTQCKSNARTRQSMQHRPALRSCSINRIVWSHHELALEAGQLVAALHRPGLMLAARAGVGDPGLEATHSLDFHSTFGETTADRGHIARGHQVIHDQHSRVPLRGAVRASRETEDCVDCERHPSQPLTYREPNQCDHLRRVSQSLSKRCVVQPGRCLGCLLAVEGGVRQLWPLQVAKRACWVEVPCPHDAWTAVLAAPCRGRQRHSRLRTRPLSLYGTQS